MCHCLQALGVGLDSVDDGSAAGSSSSGGGLGDSGGWRSVLMQRVADELGSSAATGLSNEAGEYNCFLNVIIQCLWHCTDFRRQVGQPADSGRLGSRRGLAMCPQPAPGAQGSPM